MKTLKVPFLISIWAWLAGTPPAQAQIVKSMRLESPAGIELLAIGDAESFLSVLREDRVVVAIFAADRKVKAFDLPKPGEYRLELYVQPKTSDFRIKLRFTCGARPGGKPDIPGDVELQRSGPDLKAVLLPRTAEGKSSHTLTVSNAPGAPLITLK